MRMTSGHADCVDRGTLDTIRGRIKAHVVLVLLLFRICTRLHFSHNSSFVDSVSLLNFSLSTTFGRFICPGGELNSLAGAYNCADGKRYDDSLTRRGELCIDLGLTSTNCNSQAAPSPAQPRPTVSGCQSYSPWRALYRLGSHINEPE